MTDDDALIARLGRLAGYLMLTSADQGTIKETAVRIEALTAERDEADELVTQMRKHAEAAEARAAKAEAALAERNRLLRRARAGMIHTYAELAAAIDAAIAQEPKP